MSGYRFGVTCLACGGEVVHDCCGEGVDGRREVAVVKCAECRRRFVVQVEMREVPSAAGRTKVKAGKGRTVARLPVEPLLARLGPDVSSYDMGERLGVQPDDVRRATREGLTVQRAEVWCQMLGYMPHEVWGDEWMPVPADELEAVG